MIDQQIRNAAGVYMWHRQRGDSEGKARAAAEHHCPELSSTEIDYAVGWATSALTLTDMLNMAPSNMVVTDLADKSGLSGYLGA